MAKKSHVDWSKIEPLYRAGQLSVNEIARENGLTEGAIRKHAKKNGWTRDLTEQVRAKTREKFVEELAGTNTDSTNPSTRAQPTDEQTTEQAALTQIHVLRDQRKTIGGGHKITMKLLDELEIATEHVDELKTMIVQETYDDPKARNAMLKAVSLPGRAAVMRDLAQAARTWVGLERQAFGIVEEKPDPNRPAPGSEPVTVDDLKAEILAEMAELGITPALPAMPEGVANKVNGANGKTKH